MIQTLSANEVEALESRIIGTLRKFLLKSLSVRHQLNFPESLFQMELFFYRYSKSLLKAEP